MTTKTPATAADIEAWIVSILQPLADAERRLPDDPDDTGFKYFARAVKLEHESPGHGINFLAHYAPKEDMPRIHRLAACGFDPASARIEAWTAKWKEA